MAALRKAMETNTEKDTLFGKDQQPGLTPGLRKGLEGSTAYYISYHYIISYHIISYHIISYFIHGMLSKRTLSFGVQVGRHFILWIWPPPRLDYRNWREGHHGTWEGSFEPKLRWSTLSIISSVKLMQLFTGCSANGLFLLVSRLAATSSSGFDPSQREAAVYHLDLDSTFWRLLRPFIFTALPRRSAVVSSKAMISVWSWCTSLKSKEE